MAWILQLAVECESDREAAIRVSQHFDGHVFHVDEAVSVRCAASDTIKDERNCYWIEIAPTISGKSLPHNSDPSLLNTVALHLYERLKSVAGYRFAVAGIEVFQFNGTEGLSRMVHDTSLNLDGLVLRDELFGAFGNPSQFINFAPGYKWRPFGRLR